MQPQVRILSFGYLHNTAPPGADIVIDVRRLIPPDPAAAAACRPLTGLDDTVSTLVLAWPAAAALLGTLGGVLLTLLAACPGQPLTVAFGCAGGRHRSVALAEEMTRRLRAVGVRAEVQHLHVGDPGAR